MRRAVRAARAFRRGGAFVVVAAVAVLGVSMSPPTSVAVDDAQRELVELIGDITRSTAHRYAATDDLGNSMDTAKIIWIPEAERFAAVYHTFSPPLLGFQVHLATSTDLLTWTWRATIADRAAQPSIAPAADGGYVLAWEQSPDPIHLAVAYFQTWREVLRGTAAKHFTAPVSLSRCAEGTPSIESASSSRVDLTFHYQSDCRRDREARGSLDWQTWRAEPDLRLDRAMATAGVAGHIGDRDAVTFRGRDLRLVEGQLRLEDPGTWRTFVYDPITNRAARLRFRSHAGSTSFANPTIEPVVVGGREAIAVTLFVFTEGARGGEAGQLIYYRTLPSP